MDSQPPLLQVCALLNEAGAKYLKETYREQDALDRLRLLALKKPS